MEEMKEPTKLTYEELENAAKQLAEKCNYYHQELMKMHTENLFKRLDYLFKVVNNTTSVFSAEFVEMCAREIEDMITLKEEPINENV
jgi:predicted DNA-binding protein